MSTTEFNPYNYEAYYEHRIDVDNISYTLYRKGETFEIGYVQYNARTNFAHVTVGDISEEEFENDIALAIESREIELK
jgi:hypothetical protein